MTEKDDGLYKYTKRQLEWPVIYESVLITRNKLADSFLKFPDLSTISHRMEKAIFSCIHPGHISTLLQSQISQKWIAASTLTKKYQWYLL